MLLSLKTTKSNLQTLFSLNIVRDGVEELAKKVGKSRSHITNMLGLLKLPTNVQDLVLYNKNG